MAESPLFRVSDFPVRVDPYQSAERQAFSFSAVRALDAEGNARFRLTGPVPGIQALIRELDECRFTEWSASLRVGGESATADFVMRLAPRSARAPVSVLVPSYENSESELRRSLGSCLAALQFGNFPPSSEIVLIDDGSSVPVHTKLGAFENALRSGCLRVVVHSTNRGVPATRNRAVAEARNAYAAFLDADDELHPAALATMVWQLEQGADVAAGDMYLPLSDELICARGRGVPEVFTRNSFGSGIALNLGCDAIRRLRRFQPIYNPLFSVCYEDWEANCVLWILRMRIAVIPVPLYRYYRVPRGRDASASRYQYRVKRLMPWSARCRAALARL